jgi:translation elongation factor EF-G
LQINIIHTLYPATYFTPEVEKALRAFDCGILVLCSVGGVQSKSIILDKTMRRYKLPRLVYINKLDHNGANPWEVLDQVNFILLEIFYISYSVLLYNSSSSCCFYFSTILLYFSGKIKA